MEKINITEETICNYVVTKSMKEVWQCELDILEEMDKICKKYNIDYFLSGGTLIGAIRHKGYIPWDDDIDVFIKRKEYNKFLEILRVELKDRYFLQAYTTEKKYNRGHAQIRDSRTTAIIDGDQYNQFNKGIFIDIFPLDNVPDNAKERKKFLKKVKKAKKFLNNYYNIGSSSKIKRFIKKVLHYIIYGLIDYDNKILEYEKLVSKYEDNVTKELGPISFSADVPLYKKEWFDKVIYKEFEYLKLPCPIEYDKVLRVEFNDYMQIPENKGGSMHGKVFFDTKVSYTEYEKDNKKFDKVIEFFK